MRLTESGDGYIMKLSARETYAWANRAGNRWPGSDLADKPLVVEVDGNGLCGLRVNGRDDCDCDGDELDAIVGDHLPARLRHLWPTWE